MADDKDDDKNSSQDPAREVDEFDQAWDEGENEPQADDETEQPGAGGEENPDAGEENPPEGEEPAGDTGDPGQQQAEGDQEPDYRALWEQDHQRMKSWEGRLSKEVAEKRALEERLAQLEAQLNQTAKNGPGEGQDTDEGGNGEEGVVTDAFREEYGDEIADFVEQRARELAKAEAEQLIEQRLAPFEQARQEIEVQAHYAKIAEKHPDFQEVAASEDFAKWIDGLPGTFKQAAQQVAAAGTPEEVIDLLDSFKQATNAEQRTTQQRDTRARRSAAVRSRTSGPPRRVPNGDFDAAWDSF